MQPDHTGQQSDESLFFECLQVRFSATRVGHSWESALNSLEVHLDTQVK